MIFRKILYQDNVLLNGVNSPRKLLLQQSFIDDFLRISQLNKAEYRDSINPTETRFDGKSLSISVTTSILLSVTSYLMSMCISSTVFLNSFISSKCEIGNAFSPFCLLYVFSINRVSGSFSLCSYEVFWNLFL